MKFNKTAIRSISATLVLAQLSLAMQPLMAATREDKGASSPMAQAQLKQMQALQRNMDEARASKAQAAQSPADRASAQLARIEELVRDLDDLRGQLSGESSTREQERAIGPMMKAKVRPLTADQKAQLQNRRDALWNELRGLLAKQADDQAAVRAEFAQNRQMLIDRKLPQVIMQRHDDAVRDFEQRVARFNHSLSSLSANPGAAATGLKGFFDQYPTTRRAAPVDPKNLPWRTPEPTKRMPAETQAAWFQNLYGREGTRLAQAGNNLEGITFITPPEPGTAPTAADLAETPETQRTPAIVAKAKELGNNPVNIQNWVRNNVEWVPTWGAIQSAQDTLDKKRGNAIDIASLQIALLRAAKIPARYQFGTIELPSEQVMNWVGGVSRPEAAQQLLGQGGIANRGLVDGGKISKIRLEHSWVQAYVNWAPSRGAKQGSETQHLSPQGQRNAWVPLDASFKQYVYTAQLPIVENVPFDGASAYDAIKLGATINAEEGWVQNLNLQALDALVAAQQARVKEYTDAVRPQAGAGEVVGRKIIPIYANRQLNGAIPYSVSFLGQTVVAVPGQLQHKFSYYLYRSIQDRYAGEAFLSFVGGVSQLVGKRVTLSFVPATQADADALLSYMPKAHADGSPIQPSEIPRSFPGYLVHVFAQLTVDGAIVARSSQSVTMGSELFSSGGFTTQDLSGWDLTSEESNVAGQVTAIGISAGGISNAQIIESRNRLNNAALQLESGNTSNIQGGQLVGDLLGAAIWSWFAASETQGRLSARVNGVIENPGLSYGLFHAVVAPVRSWGVVRKVDLPGVNMDIGHVRTLAWSKSNERDEWIDHNRVRGQYMSQLEGFVPSRLFVNPSICDSSSSSSGLPGCPVGVSAIQAIGSAAASGQKIFTLSPGNYLADSSIVDVQLSQHSASTRSKIRSALEAGFEVSIHQSPIVISGWRGAGYTIIDPATGAGGYLIEGGSNGSWLPYVVGAMLSFMLVPLAMLGAGLGVVAMISTGALLVYGLYQYINQVNKILDTVNLTAEQRDGSIKLLSALTVMANILGARKTSAGPEGGGLTTVILMNAMISVYKVALDWVISLHENLPSYRGQSEGVGNE